MLTYLAYLAADQVEKVPPSLWDKLTDPIVLVALITAVVGAILVKLVDAYLGRGKAKADLAAQIRDELRKDVLTTRTNLDNCEEETDKWQDKYWLSVEENAQLKAAQALIHAKMTWVEKVLDDEHPNHPALEKIKELPK